MSRLQPLLACVFLVVASLSTATDQPARLVTVPVEALLAKPSNYNGKTISVTGYCNTKDWLILYPSRAVAERANHLMTEAIFIKLTPEESRTLEIRRVHAGYLRVTGLFEHIDTSVKKIPSNDPEHFERAVIVGRSGFGPFGVYPNQLSRIRELKQLSSTE